MRRTKMVLVGIGSAALLATGGTATASAAATAADSGQQTSSAGQAQAAKKAWSCTKGKVCFYTGKNGTGKRCSTANSINKWSSKRCQTSTFKSFRNNGHSGHKGDVRGYTKTNHNGKHLTIANGARGNMAKKNPIRSVQWF
ncbi:peptidase inhibitor family I36 protein [Streptomyces sp. NPDC048172]|uniref:peptidase inhibitor family I36 protein n=1 Tax=Streptomyces sp. NPDC048172 TaxID=3365505 RepID=UPI00370FBBFA